MSNESSLNSIGKCLLYAVVFIFLSAGAPAMAGKTSAVPATYAPSPGDMQGETSINNFLNEYTDSLRRAPNTYKVKKGDSLWKIGRRYSISVKELKKLNGLKSGKLKPGQELVLIEPRIPVVKSELPQINPVSGAEAGNANVAGESQHTTAETFIMFIAERTLGIPYRFGGNSLKATDCSGYVQKVFSFMGIQLPRSARQQFNLGLSVDRGDLSVGDLVFFRTYASFPSHVGIYLGNNLFVHASALARKVTIDNLNTPYFIKRFIGAKRLFAGDVNLSGSGVPGADIP